MTGSLIGSRSSKAVYGVILITAVLLGSEHNTTDALDIAGKVLLAAIAIVVAEVYSEYLGEKIRRKKSLTETERHAISYDAFAIFVVSLYPALVFFLSYLGLYSLETAFQISYVLSLLALGAFGYVASVYAGDARSTGIKRAFIAMLIGLIVILLKYEFGH